MGRRLEPQFRPEAQLSVERIRFGATVFEVWSASARIILADGKSVPAVPHDTDAYRQNAIEHGYGTDTLRFCQEHELTHVALSHWLGIESPAIRAVAEQSKKWDPRHAEEEAAVLAVQRFARGYGVDLLERARRRQWR